MSLSERVFHAVPFFHYDVAYLRTREEYLDLAFAALDSALGVMAGDPEATFLVEQPYLLQQYFQQRPDAWKPVKSLAAEGRLEVAPGLYVMPDMAIPSGEWLTLQAETGFRWCLENLGLRPSVCFVPDPWNHPGSLPQWALKCGFTAYVFSRGADSAQGSHFRWRGIDGSEILAARLPLHYDFFPPEKALRDDAEAHLMAVLHRLDALYPPGHPVFVPIGADFAAPHPWTGPLLARLRERGIRIRFSTLGRFVDDLRAHWQSLPVLPADFSPTFQGTFSSRIALKQANRRTEAAVDRLWRLEAAGGKTHGPWREALPAALRQQFHDTISGTIIDAAAQEAAEEYEAIAKTLRAAAGRRKPGAARHVFNPSMEERTECVFLPGWHEDGAVTDTGAPVPVQRAEKGAVLQVTVPPLGTVSLTPGPPIEVFSPARASEAHLENDRLRLDLDERGTVRQVTLKGRRLAMRLFFGDRPLFNVLTLEHDFGDFWLLYRQPLDGSYVGRTPFADPLPFAKDPAQPWVNSAGAFSDTLAKEVTVLEDGPLRARVRLTGTLALQGWRAEFEQTITLHAGSPRIEFRTTVRPSAQHVRMRVAFRPSLGLTSARYQVPYGVVERGVSEHAAVNGVALNGSRATMLLLNRGLPGNGWDGDTLTLSLLRCVAMEYKGLSEGGYETGTEHVFDYAAIPCFSADQPDLCREADRFNLPLAEAADALPGAPFTWEASENVQVTRVEPMPGGCRIHGHESRGRRGRATLTVPGGQVFPVDVVGEAAGDPVPDRLELNLRPFEVFWLGITYPGLA